ncbi:MAG: hypothetical protein QW695_04190 [Candidatus Bathyarchaeia archaeon]
MFSDSIRETGFYIDYYRESWFRRFIREAESRYQCAIRVSDSELKRNLLINGMVKARAALYYLLGDPRFVEAGVARILSSEVVPRGLPSIICEMEKLFQEAQVERDLVRLQYRVEVYIRIVNKIASMILG